jgi:tRNA(Ile)-lysidine synthase
MNLLKRVQKYIEERDLLKPGDHLVLGVSGGPDSLCLLDLLHTLAAYWKLTLVVAHLNHGLRPEAAAEADFVRAQAEQRHLSFHLETVDTLAYARAHKRSIEEAARELRYAFLVQVARSVSTQLIAVAHTADDQAETVLMHFLRGSGVGGLRGMLPKTEVQSQESEVQSPKSEVQSPKSEVRSPKSGVRSQKSEAINPQSHRDFQSAISNLQSSSVHRPPSTVIFIIRPLLTTPRSEIEAYCAEHNLHPVQDATNLDTTYFRNRLRHELLPELEKYNPNIREVLRRTAEVTAGEYEILRGALEAHWAKLARFDSNRVIFNRKAWRGLKPPEQRSLLREAVMRLRPDLRNVDFTPLEHAAHFSRTAASGRSCDLLGGLRLSISSDSLTVSAWNLEPEPSLLPLLNPDRELPTGWRFCVETVEVPSPQSEVLSHKSKDDRPLTLDLGLRTSDLRLMTWNVYVDASLIHTPLRLRTRQPGDRFQPLGMGGHSLKVSDFMINIKVDSALRDHWPLVVCGEEIVWLAGLRLDERFKVTPETKTAMRLSFVKDEEDGDG